MTDEMLSQCVSAELEEQLKPKAEELFEMLSSAYAPNNLDIDTFKLVYRAMFLSSHLSIQYMLRYLEKSGLIQLPDDREAILRLNDNSAPTPEPPGPTGRE